MTWGKDGHLDLFCPRQESYKQKFCSQTVCEIAKVKPNYQGGSGRHINSVAIYFSYSSIAVIKRMTKETNF